MNKNTSNIHHATDDELRIALENGATKVFASFTPTKEEENLLRFEADAYGLPFEDYLLARYDGKLPPFQFAEGLLRVCDIMDNAMTCYRDNMMAMIRPFVPKEVQQHLDTELTNITNNLESLFACILTLEPGTFGPGEEDDALFFPAMLKAAKKDYWIEKLSNMAPTPQ